jgi:hypothetical protein
MALTSSTTSMFNATLMHEKVSPVNGITAKTTEPTMPKDQVRIVRPDEYKQAAACLAEAFREDHVVRYPGWSDALT